MADDIIPRQITATVSSGPPLALQSLVAGQNQIAQAIMRLAGNVGGLSNNIVIPPNSITQQMLVSGLSAVQLVDDLPNPVGYSGSQVVFWVNDPIGYPQLYRYNANVPQWEVSVPSTKITGQLQDSQIAAVAAAKLTGQITTTQISDDAITTPKISAGSVVTASIAAGAITAGTIAANAVTAGKIAANAVQAGNVAANAITAGTIAANAVTAGKIAAGAVAASNISVGSLSAISANLGTVTAGTLAAGVVYAGSINASQITAGTFTGFTFQTASSGARVVMTAGSALFATYDSSNRQTFAAGSGNAAYHCYAVSYLSDGTSAAAFFGGHDSVPAISTIGAIGLKASGLVDCANLSVAGSITCRSITNSGVTASNGFQTHSGTGGSYTGNAFNIDWNGSVAHLWIDNSNLGAITTSSDRRIKDNIQTLTGCLDRVKALRPVSHTWKDIGIFHDDGITHHAFIADEMQQVIPSAVQGDPDAVDGNGLPAPQSLRPYEILPDVVGAIQEMAAQIADIRSRLAA